MPGDDHLLSRFTIRTTRRAEQVAFSVQARDFNWAMGLAAIVLRGLDCDCDAHLTRGFCSYQVMRAHHWCY